MIGTLAAAALAAPSAAMMNVDPFATVESKTTRRRNAIATPQLSGRRYRNKWKAGRPKKHRNMNHVSRRTRRKHRRARSA